MPCVVPDPARPRTLAELDAHLETIRRSPREEGSLELIVRRPAVDAREVVAVAELTVAEGLVGDTWQVRPSSRSADGLAHPDMQITLMNSRAVAAIAGGIRRWPLAGDQLFVDLDLGVENVPAGTQITIGDAVLEVTDQPHTGCGKFSARFGLDALKWVNSLEGRTFGLRGINAKVVKSGRIRAGDRVSKLAVTPRRTS